MLPDLRLLIPATVATFFVAAAVGLFASVRVAQDSVEVHADGRIANGESAFTRISMSWPMPGANRAIAMQELSVFVRKAALAPLKAAAAAEPAVTVAAAPSAEEAAALQAKPESAPDAPPEFVSAPPAPSSDSDGRPDLPPLAGEADQAEPVAATTEEQEKEEDVAALNGPDARERDQPQDRANEAIEPEPIIQPVSSEAIESLPDEMGSAGPVTQTESEPAPVPAEVPLPVVASRPTEPEDAAKPKPERAVPEVVVRKPLRRTYRTRRYRIVQQPQKPKIKPAPDITELEPYERYSKSPANIFFTPVY